MKRRYRLTKKYSQKLFKRTAKGTKSINLGKFSHRGGYRL